MSLVFAVLMPVPVLPALVGAISMWRTKKLHMKGHGLALAAVIINVLYTLARDLVGDAWTIRRRPV